MSLLQQTSPELDDASRGEELTKGSSHVVWATIAATVIVTLAIAAYVITGQKPAPATGQIVAVWAYPHHTETPGIDASGAAIPKEAFDQILLFTQVRLHNRSNGPLFLNSVMANVTLGDGIHTSYAAGPSEYDRVFLAYPGIPVPHGPALPMTATINPGQTLEGTFVSSFQIDKQTWDARKSLNYTFGFRYQPSLELAPQSAVIGY